MNRRNFLAGLGAASALPALPLSTIALSSAAPVVFPRPKALRPGDPVGLIPPATEVPDPDRLALAERTINYFKLKMKRGKNVGKHFGTYRESIETRLDDLHAMFRDPEVKAIF